MQFTDLKPANTKLKHEKPALHDDAQQIDFVPAKSPPVSGGP